VLPTKDGEAAFGLEKRRGTQMIRYETPVSTEAAWETTKARNSWDRLPHGAPSAPVARRRRDHVRARCRATDRARGDRAPRRVWAMIRAANHGRFGGGRGDAMKVGISLAHDLEIVLNARQSWATCGWSEQLQLATSFEWRAGIGPKRVVFTNCTIASVICCQTAAPELSPSAASSSARISLSTSA